MKVLALEPYYGGSHRAFLDGWIRHSRHNWTLLDLPAYHWKWRMRHGAVTLADSLQSREEQVDVLFCSDMLDLPGFIGHARGAVAHLPAIAYFHESQLTYPVRHVDERDLHFAFTNLSTAIAADAVWFNSAFHREEFLQAATDMIGRMPAGLPDGIVSLIGQKALVEPPGIEPIPRGERPPDGPLRILWAARWEYDKCPEDFFAALKLLMERNIDFRLSVLGEQFRTVPPVFEQAKTRLHSRIDHWGYQESRADYVRCLQEADVVVSTAIHEFFGLSVIEAISAGARPLLPRRLAYPEILEPLGHDGAAFFYDGTVQGLADQLEKAANRKLENCLSKSHVRCVAERFFWNRRAPEMDEQLEEATSRISKG